MNPQVCETMSNQLFVLLAEILVVVHKFESYVAVSWGVSREPEG